MKNIFKDYLHKSGLFVKKIHYQICSNYLQTFASVISSALWVFTLTFFKHFEITQMESVIQVL